MPDLDLAGILDDLRRGYDGDPWHGPPLRKVLDGVTPDVAAGRPVPSGHSIWEIVSHLAAWDGVVSSRITDRRAIESPEVGDFPPALDTSPQAWDEAIAELHRQHERLVVTVAGLDDARLAEPVAGKGYCVAQMIRGVAQHMAYHAGQIALLRKLAEAGGGGTGS